MAARADRERVGALAGCAAVAAGDGGRHRDDFDGGAVGFCSRGHEAEGVPVQQEVTHGNAYGIYFFDPEGNRGEVYLRIPRDVRQPFRKSLNLEQSVEEVNAEAERLLAEDGPRYQPVTWQPDAGGG